MPVFTSDQILVTIESYPGPDGVTAWAEDRHGRSVYATADSVPEVLRQLAVQLEVWE